MIRISVIFVVLLTSVTAFSQVQPLKPVASTLDGDNVDSIAIWTAKKRSDSLVLVTEKSGGSLMIFKADRNATFLRRVGGLNRPNGIDIAKGFRLGRKKRDLAFVTERDGGKISVFSIPDFEKIAEFGQGIHKPMGISVHRSGKRIVAFVVPKGDDGGPKAIRFRISDDNGSLVAVREKEFGAELTPDQETVFFDRKTKLLYIADETAQDIKVYDFDGNLKRTFGKGVFQAQVEGISIADCRGKRYLVASDQRDVTEFEIFELPGYAHRGSVVTTASRTDGIALTTEKLPDYPKGLFIAQTDPDDTGGLRTEFFGLDQIFARAGLRCR